ncbi:MAG: hypothetical protein WC860_08980 [Candidatus Margulisiibacteriota bacterium]|jgi:hypothetical protein
MQNNCPEQLESFNDLLKNLNDFFQEMPKIESLIITNLTKNINLNKEYCLEITRNELNLVTENSQAKEEIIYNFKQNNFVRNHEEIDASFYEQYLEKFQTIYEDLANNKADLLINASRNSYE